MEQYMAWVIVRLYLCRCEFSIYREFIQMLGIEFQEVSGSQA